MGTSEKASVPRHVVRCLGAWVVCTAAATSAWGQGTLGRLPDPISGRDLNEYIERLALDREQVQTVDAIHEEYQARFRALREGAMESYLVANDEIRQSFALGLPERKTLARALRERSSVRSRIAAEDDWLFAGIEAIVAPWQVERLARIKLARARQRDRAGRMRGMSNRGAAVVVTDCLPPLDLDDDPRTLVEAVLAEYEPALTRLTAELAERGVGSQLALQDLMAARGIDPVLSSDPSTEEAVRAARAREEVLQQARDVAAEICRLNRETYARLAPHLPADAARSLRRCFLGRAYPQVPDRIDDLEQRFDAAARVRGIAPDQVEALAVAHLEARSRHERALAESLEAVDDDRSGRVRSGGGPRQIIDGARSRADALVAEADSSIESILGAALAARLAEGDLKPVGSSPGSGRGPRVAPATPGNGRDGSDASAAPQARAETPSAADEAAPDAGSLLPGPIGEGDLGRYARFLGLADAHRLLVGALHAQYLEEFDETAGVELRALAEATDAIDPDGAPARRSGAARTQQRLDRVHALRLRALAAILQADGAFFDKLDGVLPAWHGQLVARLREARERSIHHRGGIVGGGSSSAREDRLDLFVLADDLGLAAAEFQALDEILEVYHAVVAGALRSRFEAALEFERLGQEAAAARRSAEREGGSVARAMMPFQDAFRKTSLASRRAAREIADRNGASLERFVADLPPEAGERLAREYRRRAFPDLYADPNSIEPHLDAVCSLTTISFACGPCMGHDLGRPADAD